jgi:hypothetical protein
MARSVDNHIGISRVTGEGAGTCKQIRSLNDFQLVRDATVPATKILFAAIGIHLVQIQLILDFRHWCFVDQVTFGSSDYAIWIGPAVTRTCFF